MNDAGFSDMLQLLCIDLPGAWAIVLIQEDPKHEDDKLGDIDGGRLW